MCYSCPDDERGLIRRSDRSAHGVQSSRGCGIRGTHRPCWSGCASPACEDWGHGQIGNGAALNLKEQIQAIVEKCVFVENDIAFRCRGTLGSAWVTARYNTVYETARVFRLEHNVKNVKISGLALGDSIGQVFENAPGPGEGLEDKGRRTAPSLHAWPYTRLPVED